MQGFCFKKKIMYRNLKIIGLLTLVLFFSACSLKKSSINFEKSKYNGFYPVVNSGVDVFYYNDTTEFETIDTVAVITLDEIKSISRKKDKNSKKTILYIELTDEGIKKFDVYTSQHIKEKLALIFADKIFATPIIFEPIKEGKITITFNENNTDFINTIVKSFKKYKNNG